MQFHTPLNMTGKKEAELQCRMQKLYGAAAARLLWGCTTCWAAQHCCTDVEHIDGLIFLPKKAFNSFCTWMLLPTVRYTPSCVAPKMKMGGRGEGGKRRLRGAQAGQRERCGNVPRGACQNGAEDANHHASSCPFGLERSWVKQQFYGQSVSHGIGETCPSCRIHGSRNRL